MASLLYEMHQWVLRAGLEDHGQMSLKPDMFGMRMKDALKALIKNGPAVKYVRLTTH